ncbi:GxxExxY protein [uncultured Polaribacter sp.]|uniref:GxxExxY protein n=1 Tax=uncultured Polaribacter sp. TaxID=174711 RepID=UPI00261FB38D|nr:GxxExxY protein [uncultured Polaribacter sp.]
MVYKDALEYEFDLKNIKFEREKEYFVNYKETRLKHKFYSDFVVFDKIILEVKSVKEFHPKHIAQCINYLKVSGNKLCILVNFQNNSLEFKRIVL